MKKNYMKPEIKLFFIKTETPFLAGSPNVDNDVSIKDPTEDFDDTDLILEEGED